MAFVLRPPGETRSLAERLRGLSRWRGTAATLGRIGWLVAWLIGVTLLAMTLDSAFSLPPYIRAILLGASVAGTIALLAALSRRPRHDSLSTARRIEEQNPELKDALTTATALQSRHGTLSHPFHIATLHYAEKHVEQVDLDRVVPVGRMIGPFLIAIVAGGLAAIFAISHLTILPTLAARFVHPFGDHPWPHRTRIDSIQFERTIALGENFSLSFAVHGDVPEKASLELRMINRPIANEIIVLNANESDETSVRMLINASRVLQDFDFRIIAGDADSGWHAVKVVPPPRLVELDGRASPQMTLTFPDYTRLAPLELPDGAASVEAVVGTVIRLNARTDRPLKSAWLEPRMDVAGIRPAQAVAPLAGLGNPWSAAILPSMAEAFTANVPVAVSGSDRRHLTIAFSVPVNGLTALRFADDDGLVGQQLLDLRLFPDPTPKVTLLRPDPVRDSTTLLLTATVPLRARSEDSIFGTRSLTFEYRINQEDWKFWQMHGISGGSRVSLDKTATLMIAETQHDDGRKPEAGDILFLRASSHDRDDVSILKAPGLSGEFAIHLHTPESLQSELDRQLAALRKPLAQALAAQQTAEEKFKLAIDPAASDADRREAMTAMEQAQQTVRRALTEPRDGLRPVAQRLQQTARDNQLPKNATTTRLDAVAKALQRVDDKHLSAIENQLAEARQGGSGKLDSADVARHQKAVREELATADRELERWAGLAELKSDLQGIKSSTAKLERDAVGLERSIAAGLPREQLPAKDQANLDKLAAEQSAAADALTKFRDKAGKVLEARKVGGTKAGPDTDAITRAAESNAATSAADDLRMAAEAAKANRLRDAGIAQANARQKLDALETELKSALPAVDDLRKARKAAAAEIDTLKTQQDELAKKSRDPGVDEAARKKLADEQETLRRKTDQLADRLEVEGQKESAEQLRRAAESMEQSAEALARGEQPKSETTLEKLDDAKKRLEQPTPKAEELTRETPEDPAKKFKAFCERQKAAVTEFERLAAAARTAERWDRPLIASLVSLADQEAALAKEIATFAESHLKDAPVFQAMLEQSADRLGDAERRLNERKDDALTATRYEAAGESAADAACRKPMAESLRRLEQIVTALAENKSPPKPEAKADATPKPDDTGDAKSKPRPTLPPLAELKALRDWQADLNAATESFAKAHPDTAILNDDERSELVELQKSQQKIAKLFDALRSKLQPPMEELP